MAGVRARRAMAAMVALAAIYGLASEIGRGRLPDRIWMGAHYVENVELLPTYGSLADEGAFLLESRILPDSVLVSTRRVAIGLGLGSLLGILLGLAMGWWVRLEHLAEPWVTFLRFTPALALLPLYVLWFGTGEAPKVLLIASGASVVTLLGAHQGVRGVRRAYLDAAASLGASRALVFRKVVLPLAFPAIFASFRVAVALAWVTIVVAELIDPKMPSLGYLLALSGAYPRVPQMLIAIATVGVLVLAFDLLALLLHARATRWMRRATS
jgi:ABC-type nitrate/sulfonate/bicarbonate transport system permease component